MKAYQLIRWLENFPQAEVNIKVFDILTESTKLETFDCHGIEVERKPEENDIVVFILTGNRK